MSASDPRGASPADGARSCAPSAPPGPSPTAGPDSRPTSALLLDHARALTAERVTLGDLADTLGDRAFGLLMLVFALPCCVPGVPGIPTVFAIPMLLVAGQMAAGRSRPWLPPAVARRGIGRGTFVLLMEQAAPWLRRLERLARPRLTGITGRRAERWIGLYMLALAAVVAIPLPVTNTFPSIAIAVISLALIERDGALVLAGLIGGVAAVGVVLGVWGGGLISLLWVLGGGVSGGVGGGG